MYQFLQQQQLKFFNCRLHDEAHYAVVAVEMNTDIETVIDWCDSVMPHDMHKAHSGNNIQSGVVPYETASTIVDVITQEIALNPFE